MSQKQLTLVFISAHPDDNVLVAGTLSKFSQRGHKTFEIVMTNGEASIDKTNQDKSLAEIRKEEIDIYAKAMGISKVYTLTHSDGFVSISEELEKQCIKILREIQPDIIISLHPQDYHHDHRNTAQFAQRVIENAARGFMPDLGGKIQNFIMLYTDGLNLLPDPDVYVNTASTHEQKVSMAQEAYKSQMSDKLKQFVDGLAIARGGRVGYKYAEAFKTFTMPWYRLTSAATAKLHAFMEVADE